ncbi:RIP homotypic interaction motif-containing protein [Actinoplanes sp. NPDC051513]|uniref:RIP homotypic interaction motif-containing protein n=1 Tax=Actinoplanes sp. NPDC051513 TaxID=3363908 RepID=UPI0037920454
MADGATETLSHNDDPVTAIEAEPEVLRGQLIASGADRDEQILAAAQQVLALTRNVYIQDVKGVQIGDHNTQHNTFN